LLLCSQLKEEDLEARSLVELADFLPERGLLVLEQVCPQHCDSNMLLHRNLDKESPINVHGVVADAGVASLS
jgi:hypothetical protein